MARPLPHHHDRYRLGERELRIRQAGEYVKT
jgi:hypothetical protein